MLAKDIITYCLEKLQVPEDTNEKAAIIRLLLLDKYGIDKAKELQNLELEINLETLNTDLNRLNREEPVQQVIGFTYFLDSKIKVNKNVLTPRPETEELLMLTLEKLPKGLEVRKALDIGTGSGCIAISLAKKLLKSDIYAWDISSEALFTANANAEENEVKVNFELKDVLQVKSEDCGNFDLIVSNPPYVKQIEKKEMSANVLSFEPHLALFVEDSDPLLFYRKIAALASENLNKNGLLAFEINGQLGQETLALVQSFNFSSVELLKDMFGKDRFIFAVK